jgi:hypothetical protein
MHIIKTMAQIIANKATSYIFPHLHTFFEVKLMEELGWLYALEESISLICKGKHPNQAAFRFTTDNNVLIYFQNYDYLFKTTLNKIMGQYDINLWMLLAWTKKSCKVLV